MVATLSGGMPFRSASDAVGLFGAWRHFTSQAVAQGLLPLWNPHTFCGLPFLSNLQTSVFYPVNFFYDFLPFSYALLLDTLIHQVMLMTGAYALARALRLSRSSALIVAFAWGLNGSVSAHTNVGHTTWHAARAFMPWLLWMTLWFLRTGRQRYVAGFCALLVLQIAAGYPPMTMLSVALCAGLYIARALSLRFNSSVHRSSTRSDAKAKPWRTLVPFLGLTALVLCVWALPFIELNRASVHGTALPYEEASRLSGSWRSVLRLLFPDYFGGNHFQWSVHLSGAYEQIGYAGVYATLLAFCAPWAWLRLRRSSPDNENHAADWGRNHDSARRAIPWLCALVPISIVLSLGDSTPLHRWLYDHTVLFQKLRVPGRWIELWVFAVPLLAGYAHEYLVRPVVKRAAASVKTDAETADALSEVSRPNSTLVPLKVVSLIVFVSSCALGAATLATPRDIWVARLQFGLQHWIKEISAKQTSDALEIFGLMAFKSSITTAFFSIFCYTLLTIIKNNNSSFKLLTPQRAYIALMMILALDLLGLFWSSLTPTSSQEYAKMRWPTALAQTYRPEQRWTSMGFWSDTNVHLLSDVDILNGYDPMIGKNFYKFSAAVDTEKIQKYNDWFVPRNYSPLFKVAAVTHDVWRKGGREDAKTPTLWQPPQKFGEWYKGRHKSTWPRFYLSRNVVASPPERQIEALQKLVQRDFVQQNQPVVAAPRAFADIEKSELSPQDRVLDVTRTINMLSLDARAAKPSVLVAAEADFAGWRVWVNGRPAQIETVNWMFRGVRVPAGPSRVVMVYDTQTYRFALFLLLCGLMGVSWKLTSHFALAASRRQRSLRSH